MADQPDTHVESLAGAYALGALDPAERLLVDLHLQNCPACATAVERAGSVANLLPFAVEPRDPPASLETRLIARIRAERTAADRSRMSRTAWQSMARRGLPLAAAALLLIGLGSWNIRLQTELTHQRSEAALLAHAETRDLTAGPAGGEIAHGRAYLDLRTDRVLVAVSRLPELPADREYQLWFVRPDGGRDSGGTFQVRGDGDGLIFASAPAGLGAYGRIGITVEPAGGSPAPTTPNVVGGAL